MFGRKKTKDVKDSKKVEKPKDESKAKPQDKPEVESTVSAIPQRTKTSTPSIWPNISVEEATCPCCGEMASAALLDKIQKFREMVGFAIPFTSIFRCSLYNGSIKGSKYSLHLDSANPDEYGAVDCGIDKSESHNRWAMLNVARTLGANNIEVCDKHMHIGWAPMGHVMQNRLYWGVSK